MKCIAIGGVPATGKTTLMRALLSFLKPDATFKYGLLRGYIKKQNNIAILGIYEPEEVFAGTDKLSMAVQPDFDKYRDKNHKHIIFEGDRLFTKNNLLNLTATHETKMVILENIKTVLHERHIARADSQTEKFLKGRHTKLENIITEELLQPYIERYTLSNPAETNNLAERLAQFVS